LAEHFNNSIITLPASDLPQNLSQIGGIEIQHIEDRVEILSDNINQTIHLLIEQQVSLNQLQVRSRTLEDLFIKLTGHELRT
jgi:ABC-2 type transport system ATP-binding protein